ncbi:helix-turn-helix transcriptional regulator [Chitinophaga arvensicola]|uniref:AraC-type DNA-binding protein n=1 Tax=Chitinophaga arvensicola TaxID=29529 RepID=A0A1I0SAD5_9BACT|nr:AraC family transcriptional regulator [Chitinophaga arvensicola]SEW53476.1 AraC-type DNA-binding protein [Chitinophaga arvensicola]
MKTTEPNILKRFAHLLGTTVKHGRVNIPKKFGKGYCEGFVFNEHIRILFLNYELKEELVITNPDIDVPGRMILFKFHNIFPRADAPSTGNGIKEMPSVLIATSTMNTDVVIPIQTNIASVNIEVDADYLNGLFELSDKSPVLKSLLQNTQPLLFDQVIYPSLQKIVDEMLTEPVEEAFKLFFLRVKAEELICRLLMELEKRDEQHLLALNSNDIQTIYKVRAQMLEHLDTPPLIGELALVANMSPTKLKRLFKQVFGNSIFSYYQEFRMKEAARLLREEKRSVTEVGYQLGFINLSHFSRVFHEHMGMNPKKYTML